jgi:hypothetical protein
VVIDISIHGRAYRDVLRELWREQPGVWEGGKPVRRGAPEGHRCGREPG